MRETSEDTRSHSSVSPEKTLPMITATEMRRFVPGCPVWSSPIEVRPGQLARRPRGRLEC